MSDGGPHPFGEAFKPRRITEDGEHSNPVYRSFIASFGVALIEKRLSANVSAIAFFRFRFRGFLRAVFIVAVGPASAQHFIEIDDGEVFVAHGIADAYLSVEIAPLGVENVDIVQSSGAVL